jgi:negative regulator of genetic competence, sporulation and motility
MRVERISNTQIRFIFMAQDLAERDININDFLTHTTNKTHVLFQEITSMLQDEYEFAAVGTPLIFEASMTHDSLSVLVTKIGENSKNSESGITGFQNIINDLMSKFGQNDLGDNNLELVSASLYPNSIYKSGKIPAHMRPNGNVKPRVHKKKPNPESGYTVFAFDNFDTLAAAAARVNENYKGRSHVYKLNGKFNLVLQNFGIADYSTKKFETQLSEFGQKQAASPLIYNKMLEHGEVIIAEDAICKLKEYYEI